MLSLDLGSLSSHELAAVVEDDVARREDAAELKRRELLEAAVAEAEETAARKGQESLSRVWRQLDSIDGGRVTLASQKAVLLRLEPEKLEQIDGYFKSRLWAVKQEGGAKEALDRVEVASIAWQALMESAPVVAQIMGNVKAAYDRRVLSQVMRLEHAAILKAQSLMRACAQDYQENAAAKPVTKATQGPASANAKTPGALPVLPRASIQKSRTISKRSPGIEVERDGLPAPLAAWLDNVMARLREDAESLVPFGEALTVLTLSMEDLVQKARASSRQLGDVFANLWVLVLQLLRDLGALRRAHLRKCARQKEALTASQQELNESLCQTLIEHDALVSQQKKEARNEIVRLQARMRTTESRFNYQKMKIMIREGDIQKLRQRESKFKRKTIALVNRRMVRDIVNLAHRVEDAHGNATAEEDRVRLEKDLEEALNRHRELQEELIRVFAPTKAQPASPQGPAGTHKRHASLRASANGPKSSVASSKALLDVSGKLSQRVSGTRGGLGHSSSGIFSTPTQRDRRKVARQRQHQEAERKEQEKRKLILTETQGILQSVESRLKDLEHHVNHARPRRAAVRTRNARVQVTESELALQKSVTGDAKRRWVMVKGGWTTKRKLANERGNPFVPPEFIAHIVSLPVAYKAKRAPLKLARRLIYQMLQERRNAGEDDCDASGSTTESTRLWQDAYRGYVRDFFGRKYGLPQIAEPKLVDFLDALRNATREECVLADLFCRMMGIERLVGDAEVDAAAPDDLTNAPHGITASSASSATPLRSTESIDAADVAFLERLLNVMLEPGPEGTPQGPIEDKESGKLYADLVNVEEAFPRAVAVLSSATSSALWKTLYSLFAESLRLNPKAFVLPKGAKRGTLLDVLPVDEVLEMVLGYWQIAKRRIRGMLGGLFIAGDVAQDGILTETQFGLVVRAVNPGLSKLAVGMVYEDALRRGTNAEIVQRDDFVAACFAHGVYSASEWEKAEGGLAKLAKKDGVLSDADLTFGRVQKLWETQEAQTENAIRTLDAEAVTPALEAQIAGHRERSRQFVNLLAREAAREEARDQTEQDLEVAEGVEACWFALWLLRYELDKVRRTKEVSTALGSVHYLMRWKLRMREILGLDEDAPSSSIFLAKRRRKKEVVHPVFSRCRWHRTDDFLAFLNGAKVFILPEDGDESGAAGRIEFVDENPSPLDINCVDDCGNTLLHVAVQNGHDDYVQVLLDRGVNVDHQNMTGQTAMHFAKAYEHKRIFFMLRRAGASDKIRNNAGKTCHEMEEI